ncbi:PREDICTED: uncharacterized protein LOC105110184 [Populus euphratica]|uniref:Uncharacterized protein LOC105110184 n=1 Tax=Populus euphratica TaxID=75702 RepID=A0AAJ6T365_POPEU|nr:PREDICTED: uncharacterized protein LOC105110184 [Populus euphratica]
MFLLRSPVTLQHSCRRACHALKGENSRLHPEDAQPTVNVVSLLVQHNLKYVISNAHCFGGIGWAMTEFSWDVKYAGLQIMASKKAAFFSALEVDRVMGMDHSSKFQDGI